MVKIVAFYLDNGLIPDVDLSNPINGNPGCGGTEFLFVALPYYLKLLSDPKHNIIPILFAQHIEKLPKNIDRYNVSNIEEAIEKSKELNVSIFVYRPHRKSNIDLLKTISKYNIPTIAWAHITPTGEHLRKLAKIDTIKALVCVEHEQYDLIQDSPIYSKATFIVNGFDVDGFRNDQKYTKKPNLVVYLGALVPQKGFHVLAKAWPKIIARCPSAVLHVIGSGQLYNSEAKLGPWGIADEKYERNHIIPYLSNQEGKVIDSVIFMGKLGEEKKIQIGQAQVGVPNPSGQTENCPGSAIEFQALGTAVVSGAYFGILDTVKNGFSGLLGTSEKDLVNNICYLLEHPDKAYEMGLNGISFVSDKYNYKRVVNEWCILFENIDLNKSPKRKNFKENMFYNHKFLIRINRYIQLSIGKIIFWPSVVEIKIGLYELWKKIKR